MSTTAYTPTGRRAGQPTGPHAEIFRAVLREQAGRTPTHRKENPNG